MRTLLQLPQTQISTVTHLSQSMEFEENNKHKSSLDFLSKKAYNAPSWASHLNPIPAHYVSLGHFPTPIHRWNLPNLPTGTEVWLKRDDLSGLQLSGNKVRKLEFFMADAMAKGADCIITVGGVQSNHCRATAVAAKYLNLDCYLILRTKAFVDQDPGLTGNLLVGRLVGANVQLVSEEKYAQLGSVTLTNILKEKLLKEGRKPYVIPLGGSNLTGTWGYLEATREIEQQVQASNGKLQFDDIVAACGCGGTAAGLSMGSWLGSLKAKVHAFCVWSEPDYFYDSIQGLIDGLKAGVNARDILNIQNATGIGYGINTTDELEFLKEVAAATGVVLDPVYSGKAAYGMMNDMRSNPKKWEGKKVLFVHTGGLLGLYDKVDQMASLVKNWYPMEVDESLPRNYGN